MIFNKKFYFSLLLLVFAVIFIFFPRNNKKNEVVLGGKTFFVEIADTNAKQVRGLSGHKPLLDNQGMLFIFQKPDKYGFWMKDMNFPIDILWIDSNYKIIHIEKSLAPKSYPKVFYPEAPVQYVLEIPAGSSSALGIKVKDSVTFVKNNL